MASVLIIETRHDSLVSIHADDADALTAVIAFVDENWADEMGATPRPRHDDDASEAYFDEMLGTESWSIFEAALPQS